MISVVTRLSAIRSSIPRSALVIHGTRMLSAGGDWNRKVHTVSIVIAQEYTYLHN